MVCDVEVVRDGKLVIVLFWKDFVLVVCLMDWVCSMWYVVYIGDYMFVDFGLMVLYSYIGENGEVVVYMY